MVTLSLSAAYVVDRVEEMRGKEARHYNNVKEKVVKPHAKMLGAVTTGQALAPLTAASAPAIASGAKAVTGAITKTANSVTNKAILEATNFMVKYPEVTAGAMDVASSFSNDGSKPNTIGGAIFSTLKGGKTIVDNLKQISREIKGSIRK